jgi:hypothetical protein
LFSLKGKHTYNNVPRRLSKEERQELRVAGRKLHAEPLISWWRREAVGGEMCGRLSRRKLGCGKWLAVILRHQKSIAAFTKPHLGTAFANGCGGDGLF